MNLHAHMEGIVSIYIKTHWRNLFDSCEQLHVLLNCCQLRVKVNAMHSAKCDNVQLEFSNWNSTKQNQLFLTWAWLTAVAVR